MKILFLICILATLSLGVNAQQKSPSDSLKISTIEIPETYKTIPISPDSIPKFLSRLIDSVKAGAGTFEKFAFDAKIDFEKAGVHEMLWSLIIDYEDGHFVGILMGPPVHLKDMISGQKITFKKEAISEIIVKDVKTAVQTNYSLEKRN